MSLKINLRWAKCVSDIAKALLINQSIRARLRDAAKKTRPSKTWLNYANREKALASNRRRRKNTWLVTKSIDYIAWQNGKAEVEAESPIGDHGCFHCGEVMRFGKQKLEFFAKRGWAHEECRRSRKAPATDEETRPRPRTQNRLNKRHFEAALAKCLLAQRPLWDPPPSKVWREKDLFRVGGTENAEVTVEEMRKERGSTPIAHAAAKINAAAGWQVIPRAGCEALAEAGVYSLHRLRALTPEAWARLPFSARKRRLILRVVGLEPDQPMELMRNVCGGRPDPRVVGLAPSNAALSDGEVARSLKLPPLLQREVDREDLYSAWRRFDQKVTALARPHARSVLSQEEVMRQPDAVESFPVAADSDEELEKLAFAREDTGAKDEQPPQSPEEVGKSVEKMMGWDKFEKMSEEYTAEFGAGGEKRRNGEDGGEEAYAEKKARFERDMEALAKKRPNEFIVRKKTVYLPQSEEMEKARECARALERSQMNEFKDVRKLTDYLDIAKFDRADTMGRLALDIIEDKKKMEFADLGDKAEAEALHERESPAGAKFGRGECDSSAKEDSDQRFEKLKEEILIDKADSGEFPLNDYEIGRDREFECLEEVCDQIVVKARELDLSASESDLSDSDGRA